MTFYNILSVGSCSLELFVGNPYPVFNAIDDTYSGSVAVDILEIPFLGKRISNQVAIFILPKFQPFQVEGLVQATNKSSPYFKGFVAIDRITSIVVADDSPERPLPISYLAYAENGEDTAPESSNDVVYDTKVGEPTTYDVGSMEVLYDVFVDENTDWLISEKVTPYVFEGETSEFVNFAPSGSIAEGLVLIPPKSVEVDIVDYDAVRINRDAFSGDTEVVYGRSEFEIQILLYKPSFNMRAKLPQDVEFDFSTFTPPENIAIDTENKEIVIKYALNEPQRIILKDVDGNDYYIDIIPCEADYISFLE